MPEAHVHAQVARLAPALIGVRGVVKREPGLVAVGSGGVALGVVCLVAAALGSRVKAPEGDLVDAATFDIGVGIFTLTIAVLLPLAGYCPVAHRRWRRAFYVFTVYGLILETVQAFRGLDPRFTEAGDDADVILGIVFAATAGLNTILFVVLAVRFFRPDVLADRAVLRLGIRYGVIAVLLSFAVGVVMSIDQGRHIGEDGNLLLTHGLSVHGLQTIPLVAALIAAREQLDRVAWIHVAGLAWLAACVAALLQAVLGHRPFDASVLTGVIVTALAVWTVVAARSVAVWNRAGSWRAA